jgi:dihydrofolate reductase
MTVSLIVAMTDERVIGKNNRLPWHVSEDLKRFKQLTMGHPIIMGRKTFDSIGRPLPGRQNIVITRDPNYQAEGVTVVHNLCEALAASHQDQPEVFVIGGATIFEMALPLADKLYLTLIHQNIEGDTFFPQFEIEKDFRILERTEGKSAQGDLPFSFIVAEKVTALRAGFS